MSFENILDLSPKDNLMSPEDYRMPAKLEALCCKTIR